DARVSAGRSKPGRTTAADRRSSCYHCSYLGIARGQNDADLRAGKKWQAGLERAPGLVPRGNVGDACRAAAHGNATAPACDELADLLQPLPAARIVVPRLAMHERRLESGGIRPAAFRITCRVCRREALAEADAQVHHGNDDNPLSAEFSRPGVRLRR